MLSDFDGYPFKSDIDPMIPVRKTIEEESLPIQMVNDHFLSFYGGSSAIKSN